MEKVTEAGTTACGCGCGTKAVHRTLISNVPLHAPPTDDGLLNDESKLHSHHAVNILVRRIRDCHKKEASGEMHVSNAVRNEMGVCVRTYHSTWVFLDTPSGDVAPWQTLAWPSAGFGGTTSWLLGAQHTTTPA